MVWFEAVTFLLSSILSFFSKSCSLQRTILIPLPLTESWLLGCTIAKIASCIVNWLGLYTPWWECWQGEFNPLYGWEINPTLHLVSAKHEGTILYFLALCGFDVGAWRWHRKLVECTDLSTPTFKNFIYLFLFLFIMYIKRYDRRVTWQL